MKAIILAAGIGSRLWPLTKAKPKCLVKVAGRPILEYQIDAYKQAGIKEVIVVIGYAGDSIIEFCKHIKGIEITFVVNELFESTNNMYSLWLAKNFIKGEPFLLSNGDVALDESIISRIVEDARADLIAVDVDSYIQESMKISLNGRGYIAAISKSIGSSAAYGVSIDVYKFSSDSSVELFETIGRIVEVEGNRNEWTEIALDQLFNSQAIESEPFDIGDSRWVEVDNYDDLMIADLEFSKLDRSLSKYRKVFLDLDGTVYIQDKLLPGALDFVQRLRAGGARVYFLSNNSSRSKREYVEKLTRFGFSCDPNDIVLSTDALLEFLREKLVAKVWVLGTRALGEEIERSGILVSEDSPEYVVVGYDTELTYEKLVVASRLINQGVDILATHLDVVCPSLDGPIPDIGALLDMLYATTGAKPSASFGKPSKQMIRPYIDEAEHVLIVGDRLYTDILLAKDLNADSILVLTGDTSRDDLENSNIQPTLSLRNLSPLAGVVG